VIEHSVKLGAFNQRRSPSRGKPYRTLRREAAKAGVQGLPNGTDAGKADEADFVMNFGHIFRQL
jgi:hypothetical protein